MDGASEQEMLMDALRDSGFRRCKCGEGYIRGQGAYPCPCSEEEELAEGRKFSAAHSYGEESDAFCDPQDWAKFDAALDGK